MILKINQNTPVAAPQLGDVTAVLSAYRTWKGFAFLTVDDLFAFMIIASPEREEFLNTLSVEIGMVKTNYATQTYE